MTTSNSIHAKSTDERFRTTPDDLEFFKRDFINQENEGVDRFFSIKLQEEHDEDSGKTHYYLTIRLSNEEGEQQFYYTSIILDSLELEKTIQEVHSMLSKLNDLKHHLNENFDLFKQNMDGKEDDTENEAIKSG